MQYKIFLKQLQCLPLFLLILLCLGCKKDDNPKNQFENQVEEIKIVNPVLNINFPDPTVMKVGDIYYAYATNGYVGNKFYHVPMASSTDLKTWKFVGETLYVKPVWATKDFWAPHVLFDAQLNKYVMFYSGELGNNTGKCIGVAFSSRPDGPFIDSGEPIICGRGFDNIDPFVFIDPKTGKKLMYWGSAERPIKVQELSDDWKSFKPGSTAINALPANRNFPYERLIEGAWVDYHEGKYYLYYSGDNCCGSGANYAVLVARSDNATGPFQRYSEANGTGKSVILEKDKDWLAPGHNSIFKSKDGQTYTAYHALPIDPATGKAKGTSRVMMINKIEYVDGWPKVIK